MTYDPELAGAYTFVQRIITKRIYATMRTNLRKLSRGFQRKKKGLAPGTLVYGGAGPTGPVRLRVIDYDASRFAERMVDDVEDLAPYKDSETVTWINVDGVHDTDVIGRLGALFGIHPLTLEDIVSTNQRAKLEEYPTYVYIVVQMTHYDRETAELRNEQVSLVFGRGFLISFQEAIEGDVFEPVRQRLRDHRGRIRLTGADFLAYSLIDLVVDHYMVILEDVGERIERLEDDVTTTPHPDIMQEINRFRHNVMRLRRTIWPLRDVISAVQRSELPYISPETDVFLRDVYDHAIRTVEIIETTREMLASLTDLHVSALSFRMNEIMKLLAIIATFFLPLTFLAGVFGMNFNPDASPLNMPELEWYFGYPAALGAMALIALGMFAYFRKRGWM